LGNPLEDLSGFLEVKARADAFWSRDENAKYRREWASLLDEPVSEVPEKQPFLGLD
jgi:hypothetical protein